MRKLPVLSFLLMMFLGNLLGIGSARAQDKIEIFGGYSYLHASTSWNETVLCPGPTCPVTVVNPKLNLNGWEASGVYNLTSWLGAKADFSGHYGSFNGISFHETNYLFGPQLRMPGKISPFAHALFGGAHTTSGTGFGSGTIITPVGGSPNNGFAAVLGAGIDVKVLPFLYFRPVQIDSLLTRLYSGTQSQLRYSAGIVLHF
jgi:hypothetical protein